MFFHIALKDIKIIFRDRKALAVMLLMPALIILILGSALGSMFDSGNVIERFAVGVVNKDEGFMSQVFINNVMRDDMSDMFDTHVVSEEKADEMLAGKEVSSIIIIPEGFTSSIEKNQPVSIEVKSGIDQQFKAKIIDSVVNGFARNISLSYAGAFAAIDIFKIYDIPIPKPVDGISEVTVIMSDLQKKLGSELIEFSEENQEMQRTLTAIQYYSASMLVMFMLFGASMGTKLLVEERENKTLGRIMSTRTGKTALITGKFLGLMFICILQSVVLISFTRVIYGVDWGISISGVILITFCAVFAATGFGMMIAAIAKTAKAADGIAMVCIQLFTLIGGGMIPMYVFPEAMKKVASLTLNWWAVKGYHDLMVGADISQVIPYCGILIAMGIAYLSIGILRFRVE